MSPQSTYAFRVKFQDDEGFSDWSPIVSVSTLSKGTLLHAVSSHSSRHISVTVTILAMIRGYTLTISSTAMRSAKIYTHFCREAILCP